MFRNQTRRLCKWIWPQYAWHSSRHIQQHCSKACNTCNSNTPSCSLQYAPSYCSKQKNMHIHIHVYTAYHEHILQGYRPITYYSCHLRCTHSIISTIGELKLVATASQCVYVHTQLSITPTPARCLVFTANKTINMPSSLPSTCWTCSCIAQKKSKDNEHAPHQESFHIHYVHVLLYVCLSGLRLGGLLYLSFLSYFFKLVCYAHVFPCTSQLTKIVHP